MSGVSTNALAQIGCCKAQSCARRKADSALVGRVLSLFLTLPGVQWHGSLQDLKCGSSQLAPVHASSGCDTAVQGQVEEGWALHGHVPSRYEVQRTMSSMSKPVIVSRRWQASAGQ